jgi:F-type H+-transporting ATPase subunit a
MISHTVVAAGFSTYQPFSFTQSIANVSISIFLTTLVISILFIIYRVKIKKQEAHLPSSNYVICFQIYIEFIRNMVIEVLGKKFEKITPFFIYLFSYILLSNTISIFGFANPTSSLSVTLSLGVVTFVGIFVIGIKYQKWSFLKKYTFNINTKKKSIPVMINPLNIIGQITPLISLSFRL